MSGRRGRAADTALWLAASAGLLGLSWLALAPKLFFSSDTGLRFIQIQNLLANRFSSFAIRYAPAGLDDDPLQAPYYWARSIVDGEIYLHISSLFPIGAAAAFDALGTPGLALLPALGSVATGCAVHALARLCQLPHARWIGLLAVLATPLLFYAIVLWDHSPITALAIWGVYGVARGLLRASSRAALLGGVALGLATTQRPEFGALALALAVALLLQSRQRGLRPLLWTAAGGVLGAAPLWLLQQLWVGHPLGMAVAPNLFGYGDTPEFGRPALPFAIKLWRFLFYVEGNAPQAPWAFGMVAGGLGCLALAFRRRGARTPGLLGVGFAAMLCGYLLLARLGLDFPLIGLAATFPLLPLLVARPGRGASNDARTARELVQHTAILFCAIVMLAWPSYGGLQWGARYLLPAYPLLCLMAADGFIAHREALLARERSMLLWGAGALLALALILEGVGVKHRFEAREELAEAQSTLQQMSVQLVATDRYFLPAMLASMTPEIVFLDVVGDAEIQALIPRAVQAGIARMAVVSHSGRRVHMPASVAGTRVLVTPHSDGYTLIELTSE